MSGRHKSIKNQLDQESATELDAKNPDYYRARSWRIRKGLPKFASAEEMINSYNKAKGSKKPPVVNKLQARQEKAKGIIKAGKNVSDQELASSLGVSPKTARRDLDALEKTGTITRDTASVTNDGFTRKTRDLSVVGEPSNDNPNKFGVKQNRELSKPENHRISKDAKGSITLERKVDGKWQQSMKNKDFKNEQEAKDYQAVGIAMHKAASGQRLTGQEKQRLKPDTTATGKLPKGQTRRELDRANKKASLKSGKPAPNKSKFVSTDTNDPSKASQRDPKNPNSTPAEGNNQRVKFDPATKKYVPLKDGDTKRVDGKTFVFNSTKKRWYIKKP